MATLVQQQNFSEKPDMRKENYASHPFGGRRESKHPFRPSAVY
jgi:hypothetical protein